MHPLLPFLIDKIAAEEPGLIDKAKSKVKGVIDDLNRPNLKRQEIRLIKQQIRESKPKTQKEKHIEQLAGKKWTKEKFLRAGAIGATMGTAAQGIGSFIEGSKAGRRPRSLARGAVIGAMLGAATPAATRFADVEAAKRGLY